MISNIHNNIYNNNMYNSNIHVNADKIHANKIHEIFEKMKTEGISVVDLHHFHSFSGKKYAKLVEYPEYLLVDFTECNEKSAEIFIVDNSNGLAETEILKFSNIGKFFKENLKIKVPKLCVIDKTRILVENLGSKSVLDLALNSSHYGVFQRALEDSVEILSKLINYPIQMNKDTNSEELIYQRVYEKAAILEEMKYFLESSVISEVITQKELDKIQLEFEIIIKEICKNYNIIHRDFQSANLLFCKSEVVLIDFQDASLGPRLYDMASLLYDLKICISNTERKRLAKKLFSSCRVFTGLDESELFRELYYNGLVRLCKSLNLRFRHFKMTMDSEDAESKIRHKALFLDIKKGIDIFYVLKDDLERIGYEGELLKILENAFNKFNHEYSSGIISIILGAGQGKRMGGDLPKVLQRCLDLPMIEYPLRTSKMIGSDSIYLVIGYKKEEVINYIEHNIGHNVCNFVVQDELLGTGHAVMQVVPYLVRKDEVNYIPEKKSEIIVVMLGDVPVIDYKIMQGFLEEFKNPEKEYLAGILTTDTPYPDGSGRIIRNRKGDFIGTIEEKDIKNLEEEKEKEKLLNICEISTGVMMFRSNTLVESIFMIDSNNSQNEYYLPDVINTLLKNNKPVLAYNSNLIPAIHGANTREQLELVENWMNSYTTI